ncbi:hypothetical protein [Bacillus sp. 179-C3.3 HS]|uniref:hypothetical protein n=1 Tax=Bacillus sp. 179-C3.3 HS TaxID=3232162 RepID=UPI0039A12C78
MKNPKKKILVALLFVLLISSYFLFFYNSKKQPTAILSNEFSSKLEQQQHQNIKKVENSWKDDTLFTLINAVNDTEDEYTSYYFHQSALLLNQPTDEKFCNTQFEKLEEESFAKDITDNMIFTGIERVYRAYQSIKNCKGDATPLIKKHTQYLLNTSFYKDGFFLSEEFKEFKDNPDYMDVKLQQTHMMLVLLSDLNLMQSVNKHKISLWVDKIKPEDFVTLELILDINEKLQLDSKYNLNSTELKKRINKKNLDFDDLLEINSFVNLNSKNLIKKDKELLNSISKKIRSFSFEASDIQSEYFKLNILKNLNVEIDPKEKEAFIDKFSTFEYENGMFPAIAPFNNSFSPILIGKDLSEFPKNKAAKIDKIIRSHLSKVTFDDLVKLDALEIYSYISLLDLTDHQHNNQLNIKLKQYLTKKVKEPIDVHTIMNWSFYTRSLLKLESDFERELLPDNTNEMITKITKYPESYYDEEKKITSLVFLDTLARTELYSSELESVKSDIRDIPINVSIDIAAYLIYYKVSVMEKLEIEYDKNEVAQQITSLFKKKGYSLNKKQNFPDIYSTYLITNANKMVMGVKHE